MIYGLSVHKSVGNSDSEPNNPFVVRTAGGAKAWVRRRVVLRLNQLQVGSSRGGFIASDWPAKP